MWLGSQAFYEATAFNANIASWNVLSVTTYTGAFDSIGLADCIKRGVYDNWGSTLQTAYPTWSSLCATPTAAPSAQTAITNANIAAAVTSWVTNPTTAATMYGNIVEWNTAAVTSMASVLASRPTFNADISKWNTASVSNMYQVCASS